MKKKAFPGQKAGKIFKKKPNKPSSPNKPNKPFSPRGEEFSDLIRLNKYIANSGICSRREADVLITSGAIKVNGEIVTELGTKVKPADKVVYGDERLKSEKNVYVLLNKPKDFITTSDDPQGRRTVLELVKDACNERIFPVGRLDRNTTGLLLLTNDGELTKKLTHPKYGVRKIYHVFLDKPLTKSDFVQISEKGVTIDDEIIIPDDLAHIEEKGDKKQVGIELHSGKNRIVRRIFESLGYKIEKLDRVVLGSLTKKDLPRGRYRILSEKEVSFLKMLK